MKLNRKNMTVGVAGLGLVGILAGGASVAAAASRSADAPAPSPTTSTCPYAGTWGVAFGMHGMAGYAGSPISAAASYLGLSQTDLQARLRAGESLADVAKAQGKTVSGLEDAMLAAIRRNLDADGTTLTRGQKDAIYDHMKSRIDIMVNAAHMSGRGISPMGRQMRGMMR
ncbi:hypothetical protein J5X84_39750 [Streptosporangiaceae bacterium NEAU-GS5]|nr:hypothetical protein [Streptosporangiaceae bacterium NEAU-GS5]